MKLEKERIEIVKYGRRLVDSKLTKGTGGNLSVFNRAEQLMAISPSGIDYYETQPEDVVVLNLAGEIIEGDKKPSSEVDLHRIFYQGRDDLDAIIHTHTVYATTLSCLRWELPAVHYLIAVAGKNVRCADYATFGTQELAENAFKAMKDRRAVLLANHGLVAGAETLEKAFSITEEIEYVAELYYRTKGMGEPVILDDEEMAHMAKKFKSYGQK